ncbi:MAG: hypothetical protein IT425_09695 [Pirellulales bacterium]|nr:hypothetical protein [Pirellulales bacterium]
MAETFEILLGDVTDMAACVRARYRGAGGVVVRGWVRGPYCERSRTLPAKFPFRAQSPENDGLAEAIVTDPCLWSEQMPHLYRIELEALQGDQVVDRYCGDLGLRRLAPRLPIDFAPGTG